MMFKSLLVISFWCLSTVILAQDTIREYVAPPIKSVVFNLKGVSLSYPVWMLGDENPLLLAFDDTGNESETYNYTITLCNADWTETRLAPSEYLPGLMTFQISDFQPSFNTLVHFTHYKIELPNEDLPLKLAGNYVVKVYSANDSEHPVLIKRFVVLDKRVDIEAQVILPNLPEYRKNSQQLNFSILNPDFPISNPNMEVSVVILKNFDWNTALTGLKPLFIRPGSLDYNYQKENLFLGGNEFRSFNINSRKYASSQVAGFEFDGSKYKAYLVVDKPRYNYFSKEDIDGLFYNENKDGHNADNDLESDYFEVHFLLDVNILPEEGDLFVYGAFSNYQLDEDTRMRYNPDKHIYECSILLKQGYYDYQYVFLPKKNPSFDETEVEGSFSETENNYFILVYYRGFGQRYDKPIGFSRVTWK